MRTKEIHLKGDKILIANKISKNFQSGNSTLDVLKDVSFSVEEGASIAIVGPSGSGKSTLLGICAGLDTPSSGSVELDGKVLSRLSPDRLALLRNKSVGFVFQSFRLIPSLRAIENVMVPAELKYDPLAYEKAAALLDKVGLSDRMEHYPAQLSGGEQQRVAIARAFINAPKVIFADEPTGNLDAKNSDLVTDLLFNLNKEQGTTLILVTHNTHLADKTNRTYELESGVLN